MTVSFSKENLGKLSVLMIVLVFFISGAIGLVEITIGKNNILSVRSEFLNSPEVFRHALDRLIFTADFAILLFSGLLLLLALPFLPPLRAAGFTLILLVFVYSYGYLKGNTGLVPVEYCMLTLLVIYIVYVLISYFIEIQSRNELLKSFSQYIPAHLVSELDKKNSQLSLEGEAKTLTVFFCDLQNFTSISEELNPRQLNKLLNEYFTIMSEILFKYSGTIDKYIGDAIMAFWNAPTTQPAHAQFAVEAALEMDEAIRALAKTFIGRGWPGPTMGIGVNTGRANVGNMGSKYRMTYTAIGDAVNLASRIETLTRTYRVPIIISENTRNKLDGIICRELDQVRVKGKRQMTRIYQPLCKDEKMDTALREKIILHEEALGFYYEEKYKNAARLFRELYDLDKNDKYYKAMIVQIQDKLTTAGQ